MRDRTASFASQQHTRSFTRTLVLIIASGERSVEYGRRLKLVKGNKPSDGSREFWPPNFLGRVYRYQKKEARRAPPGPFINFYVLQIRFSIS